jgi:hypothetical protein
VVADAAGNGSVGAGSGDGEKGRGEGGPGASGLGAARLPPPAPASATGPLSEGWKDMLLRAIKHAQALTKRANRPHAPSGGRAGTRPCPVRNRL